jgi:hypothetical protein
MGVVKLSLTSFVDNEPLVIEGKVMSAGTLDQEGDPTLVRWQTDDDFSIRALVNESPDEILEMIEEQERNQE